MQNHHILTGKTCKKTLSERKLSLWRATTFKVSKSKLVQTISRNKNASFTCNRSCRALTVPIDKRCIRPTSHIFGGENEATKRKIKDAIARIRFPDPEVHQRESRYRNGAPLPDVARYLTFGDVDIIILQGSF